jgi:hypothetical protein
MRKILRGLAAVAVCAMTAALPAWAAEEPSQPVPTKPPEGGQIEEGTGFSMFGTESIKGFDESKVEKDPVCDRSKRPKIMKVEPDEAKPGEKIVVKGENFGTKECFHGVAFSAAPGTPVQYKFVNETAIEVVVPDTKSGMSFIDVVAGGGNARSKGFLIKAK